MPFSSSRTIRPQEWANRPSRPWRPHWATPSSRLRGSAYAICPCEISVTLWRVETTGDLDLEKLGEVPQNHRSKLKSMPSKIDAKQNRRQAKLTLSKIDAKQNR